MENPERDDNSADNFPPEHYNWAYQWVVWLFAHFYGNSFLLEF